MDTPADRKRILLAMKADILERLHNAQADLDAVERLLAVQEEIEPSPPSASVEEVRQACVELLCNHGTPVHRNILLEKLNDMGIQVSGKVPVNNLGSILSRFSEDFEPHGNGVWGLKTNKAHSGLSETVQSNGHGALIGMENGES